MIPRSVTMIPLFTLLLHIPLVGGNSITGMGGKGLYDTLLGLILPEMVGATSIFLCRQFFQTLPLHLKFDFIYIDGSHHAHQVMVDARHAHERLKRGGILAFDDYEWIAPERGDDVPQTAIDAFLDRYGSGYDVLDKHVQVWLKKEN